MKISDIKESLKSYPHISSASGKCNKNDDLTASEDTEISKELKYLSSMTAGQAELFLADEYHVFLEPCYHLGICLAITNNDQYIVCASDKREIKIWDFQHRTLHIALKLSDTCANCISLTSDNKYIIAGCSDSTIRVLNFESNIQV